MYKTAPKGRSSTDKVYRRPDKWDEITTRHIVVNAIRVRDSVKAGGGRGTKGFCDRADGLFNKVVCFLFSGAERAVYGNIDRVVLTYANTHTSK